MFGIPCGSSFIQGDYKWPVHGEDFATTNPATGHVITHVARGCRADVDAAVDAARSAQPAWAAMSPSERAACLQQLASVIGDNVELLADIEVRDAGKPRQLAKHDVAGCIEYFRYYAGAIDKFLGSTIPLGPGYLDYTQHEPLGVSAHIVPWNAPINMLCRSLAPALAMGNSAVVKPAEQTPLSSLKLAELFSDYLPQGLFNVVTGLGEEAGEALAKHPDADSVTFTGSVATGRKVLHAAADHIKPVVLELGGKAPQIVLPDADLDDAAAEIAKGAFTNSGQYCDAGARLLVHDSIAEPLIDRIVAIAAKLTIGPGAEDPDLGPLVSRQHFEHVCGYLSLAQEQGAQTRLGGAALQQAGYFVPPTVFTQVTPEMRVFREEIFGPVLTATRFGSNAEALTLANDCDYGLAAGIYTRDINSALWLTEGLEAGYVMINEYFAGGVNTPFGGSKNSGYSRERGMVALENYTRLKNVVVSRRSPTT
ncbi:aldehyde dehydrogenase family protein [Salinisphaera sp. USBA-960]|nr:aldehyde dehydrogenase family protein [Salifodinibacter halophilus]NNC25605.1 aldehyde dehydrogenase family protein [Salifodinibacter halophilus]